MACNESDFDNEGIFIHLSKELPGRRRFPNSMGYPDIPRRVAAIAMCKGEIAGIAGACADSDNMWQIGVDTLPEFRNRGIGKAIVSAVTGYTLIQGKIPYYSTVVSNLASRAVAISLGYKPAWVELYVREVLT